MDRHLHTSSLSSAIKGTQKPTYTTGGSTGPNRRAGDKHQTPFSGTTSATSSKTYGRGESLGVPTSLTHVGGKKSGSGGHTDSLSNIKQIFTQASGQIDQGTPLKDDTSKVHGLERKMAIISLNPAIIPLGTISQEIVGNSCCQAHSDTKVAAHGLTQAQYLIMAPGGHQILSCFTCALKFTLHSPVGSMSIEQKLSKSERMKKASLENFLRRIDLFVECLSNSKLSGERKRMESYQRYQNDVTKIVNFFTHVMRVFNELYEKIINERTSRYNSIKEDHEEKLKLLLKHFDGLTELRADCVLNFDNILVCMEEEPFAKIIKKYGSSVDHIQKMFEDQKLEQFPVYEDTVENLRGMNKINESLQSCLNQIHRTFESNLLSSSVSVSLLVEGGNGALNEELKKINDCFYNTSQMRSSASIDMYSRVHHDPSPIRASQAHNSFILEMTSSKSIKLAMPPSTLPKSPKEALKVLDENPEETERLSI